MGFSRRVDSLGNALGSRAGEVVDAEGDVEDEAADRGRLDPSTLAGLSEGDLWVERC